MSDHPKTLTTLDFLAMKRAGRKIVSLTAYDALMARMRQFPGQEKQVLDYYRKNPQAMMELRGPIFEQKVVDSIVAKATVTDKPVSREELQSMVQDEDDGVPAIDEHEGHDHA